MTAHGTSWQALVAAVATTAALLTLPDRWLADNGDTIRQAVLRDLLEDPLGARGWPVVCVHLWAGSSWYNPPGLPQDPSPAFLEAIRSPGHRLVPASECDAGDVQVTERATGMKAVLIGVAEPTRIRDDFARVEAGRYWWELAMLSREYRLTRVRGRWLVNAPRTLWIS